MANTSNPSFAKKELGTFSAGILAVILIVLLSIAVLVYMNYKIANHGLTNSQESQQSGVITPDGAVKTTQTAAPSDNMTTPAPSDNATMPAPSDNTTTPMPSDNTTTPAPSNNMAAPAEPNQAPAAAPGATSAPNTSPVSAPNS